jgi:hypothetical protein
LIDIYNAKGKLLFSSPNPTRANEILVNAPDRYPPNHTYYCGHDGGAHRAVFKREGRVL